MNLLILGGTVFLGRHLVAAATAGGHRVTLFNRGRSAPELFPELEQLRGDRDGDLTALDGRRFDAVIDTCGYVPRLVAESARALAPQVGHYTFISTVSVYADAFGGVVDESAPLDRLQDPATESVTGETYGPLKALCEEAVAAELPHRHLIVRPGLIIGPHDPSDRFTWWPVRLRRGGATIAPGSPDANVQLIDVRDLADWLIECIAAGRTGTFNATGPASSLSMTELLTRCNDAVGGHAALTWLPNSFLLEREVRPWIELPLWIPGTDMRTDIRRALDAGLRFRSVEQSAVDTLEWAASRAVDHPWKAGLSSEREEALLAAWRDGEQDPAVD